MAPSNWQKLPNALGRSASFLYSSHAVTYPFLALENIEVIESKFAHDFLQLQRVSDRQPQEHKMKLQLDLLNAWHFFESFNGAAAS